MHPSGVHFLWGEMGLERALEGIHFTAYIIFVHCELLSYAIFVLTIASVKPPHDLHLYLQYMTILPYSSR